MVTRMGQFKKEGSHLPGLPWGIEVSHGQKAIVFSSLLQYVQVGAGGKWAACGVLPGIRDVQDRSDEQYL
jgi:hypothetical protein